MNGTDGVEIKIPVRSLVRELEDQIPLASAHKDLPKGRKRAGWRKDFLRSVQKAAADLGDISEEEILKAVREYRSGQKKLPGLGPSLLRLRKIPALVRGRGFGFALAAERHQSQGLNFLIIS
jgi:hypothetical protein